MIFVDYTDGNILVISESSCKGSFIMSDDGWYRFRKNKNHHLSEEEKLGIKEKLTELNKELSKTTEEILKNLKETN